MIDEEVQHIIDDAYIAVIALLKDKMSILNAVANRLLEKEKIEGDEFERIFVGESLPESVSSDPIVTESPAPEVGL